MLNAEILKVGSDILLTELTELVGLIWTQEEIPDGINDAVIVALHKNGDKKNYHEFRGLSLLTTIYKIIVRVIYKRLLPYTEPMLGEYQAGFRSNRSTSEHIFTLRQVFRQVVRDDSGVMIGSLGLKELSYADDVVILAEDMRSLDLTFCELVRAAGKIGLRVNETKTKLMHVQRRRSFAGGHEIAAGFNLELVDSFAYLGSKLSPENDILK
ncbi:uncharacterized protein LOC143041241 [Oratosquilla oratoria]|uniref:uncharacterized protein LOC143041241 n=1 Tax=Oratosquilla oratoria TaxID=337810 RepID=UPI003F762B8E